MENIMEKTHHEHGYARRSLAYNYQKWNRFIACCVKLESNLAPEVGISNWAGFGKPVMNDKIISFASKGNQNLFISRSFKGIGDPLTELESELLQQLQNEGVLTLNFKYKRNEPIEFFIKVVLAVYKHFFPKDVTIFTNDPIEEWEPALFFIKEVVGIDAYDILYEDLECLIHPDDR
jgi:hypothetical protein